MDKSEGTNKLLEAIPDLYSDLAKPVVQEAGKLIALPLQIVNALLNRPKCWIANANYKIQETNELIANKLQHIKEEKIIAPSDYVAVPALQALSYSIDSNEIRELYANLIAKAMNVDTSVDVHPAYIDIIRQLSPLDAVIFNKIAADCKDKNRICLYNINLKLERKVVASYTNIVNIVYSDAPLKDVSQSIDNLMRCGLLAISNRVFVDFGDIGKEMVNWTNIMAELKDGMEVEVPWASAAYITGFGKGFYSICCT